MERSSQRERERERERERNKWLEKFHLLDGWQDFPILVGIPVMGYVFICRVSVWGAVETLNYFQHVWTISVWHVVLKLSFTAVGFCFADCFICFVTCVTIHFFQLWWRMTQWRQLPLRILTHACGWSNILAFGAFNDSLMRSVSKWVFWVVVLGR